MIKAVSCRSSLARLVRGLGAISATSKCSSFCFAARNIAVAPPTASLSIEAAAKARSSDKFGTIRRQGSQLLRHALRIFGRTSAAKSRASPNQTLAKALKSVVPSRSASRWRVRLSALA